MKDYKIRVANEAESKEAQELFFELGCSWSCGDTFFKNQKSPCLFVNKHNQISHIEYDTGFFEKQENKEITIPQLRDLVVLKRGDVGDANYTDQDDWKWYIGANSYVWQAGNSQQLKQWDKSSLDMVNLKPIEKTMSIFDTGRHVVKEYLDPDNGYVLITADEEIKGDSNWIEVPEGADIYIELTRKIHGFYKDNFKFTHHGGAWRKTEADSDYCWINHPVLWQRNKQPEELLNISESPESSIKKLKVEWFEKFLDGVKVQYRIGVAVGKKDAQWHNFTSNALKDMTHNLIEFREAPKHVTLDGIAFKTQESLLKYIVNNYNFD